MDIPNLIEPPNQIGDFFGAWPNQDQIVSAAIGPSAPVEVPQ